MKDGQCVFKTPTPRDNIPSSSHAPWARVRVERMKEKERKGSVY
jgi:hypothetical protein